MMMDTPQMQNIELTAMSMYRDHVKNYPNAPSWWGLPLAERDFWLREAGTSISYENSGLNKC